MWILIDEFVLGGAAHQGRQCRTSISVSSGECGKAFSVAPSDDSNFPSRPRKLKLIRLVIFSQARVNTTDIHTEE
jgi:hypothetical protein